MPYYPSISISEKRLVLHPWISDPSSGPPDISPPPRQTLFSPPCPYAFLIDALPLRGFGVRYLPPSFS